MGELPGLSGVAGALHAALIANQLAEERARKTSLEQRALAVITTSGVLAMLLIGLAAFVVNQAPTTAHVDDMSRRLVVAAAAGFIAAAVLALAVVSPRKHREADLTAPDASITLRHAQDQNRAKAVLLFLAAIAEVAGVIAAGIAAAITAMAS